MSEDHDATQTQKRTDGKPATPEAATRLHDLARDIASHDWSLEDVVDQKARLRTADREYLYALDGSDPTIFRHRFSELFPKD